MSGPPTNYVLIDYENLQPAQTHLLAPEHFKVIVFVGSAQTKVSVEMASALQAKGSGVRYIRSSGAGKNALDFHLIYYLGQLATLEPQAYFHVVTGDRGMDPLMQHLQATGVKVQRSERINDIPIVKTSNEASPDERASTALAYLVSRGTQRPSTVKTFRGSISALFNPRLDEKATDSLLKEFELHGILEIRGSKITYFLAD